MGLETQKNLRFFIPGILIYALCSLICWATNWCELAFPTSYEEVTKATVTVAFGMLYLFTGLREFSNGPFHSRVNANIVDLLTRPFQQTIPTAARLPWKQIRIIFYHFVDTVPSLEKQSKIIRFNGLFWTSVADVRVIAYFGIAILAIAPIIALIVPALAFGGSHWIEALAVLWAIALGSFPISHLLTERHRRLGEDQCDVIVADHRKVLEEKLQAAVKAMK